MSFSIRQDLFIANSGGLCMSISINANYLQQAAKRIKIQEIRADALATYSQLNIISGMSPAQILKKTHILNIYLCPISSFFDITK